MRKYYLDNLRSLTIVLVLIYHAFYLFNGVGVQTGLNVEVGFLPFDAFCTAIYPWFMVLLFCIAGITARYSISKRGRKSFIKERFRRSRICDKSSGHSFHGDKAHVVFDGQIIKLYVAFARKI